MKIALVSVTLNAVNPMTNYFRKKNPDIEIRNYLDSFLMDKIRKEGGVNDSSVGRMFSMLEKACEDGADAVLLTCTVFSPYARYFSALLSKKIVCPDRAMLENVAALPGRTAIICTFSGTVETTKAQYFECLRELGRPEAVDVYVLDEAYNAAGKGDFAAHDRLIKEKVEELDFEYENIVLAQISMAAAKDIINTSHAAVFTSPDSAYQAILAAAGEE